MRLDKYLKVSRLIKRRSVAKLVCDQGRVLVNGRPAKSSTNVEVGDQIQIEYGTKILTVEVQAIKDTTKKHEAQQLFKVVSEEAKSQKSQGPEFY